MLLTGIVLDRGHNFRYGILPKYEAVVARVLERVLRKDAKVFIDAGAFHGYFTLQAYRLLRKKGGTIIALEPNPANFRKLVGNIPADGVIHAVRAALWVEDNRPMEFLISGPDAGGCSMGGRLSSTKRSSHHEPEKGRTILVDTVRLDTLIKKYELPTVDLVKMDIEGADTMC
ncbi:MAG: FkbM family methyltransferase [Candidatus Caldarchaeum sp.]|nr:FkbM family methyltransferase [Candidatus Caldarchaeum sp.]